MLRVVGLRLRLFRPCWWPVWVIVIAPALATSLVVLTSTTANSMFEEYEEYVLSFHRLQPACQPAFLPITPSVNNMYCPNEENSLGKDTQVVSVGQIRQFLKNSNRNAT